MITSDTYSLAQKQNIADIVQSYSSRLKGFIRNLVSSKEDTEDILQDVFYQLAEADRLMKPIEQITAWLYTVARNRVTDFYRKKKPESISEYIDTDEDLVDDIQELLLDTEPTPDTRYLQSLVWEELEKALSELPQEQRMVFELNELEGISFKELAKLTGETENTLISRKRYAVLHLRKRLQALYNELLNFN